MAIVLTCESCGAPLGGSTSSAHAICSYCSATNVVATEQAVQVAKVLDRHNIRFPDNPRSLSQIEAELTERRDAEESKRRSAVLISVVILVLVGVGILALAVTGNLTR